MLDGEVPIADQPAVGLPVPHPVPKAQQLCSDEEPHLIERGQGHPVACHFAEAVPVTVWQDAKFERPLA